MKRSQLLVETNKGGMKYQMENSIYRMLYNPGDWRNRHDPLYVWSLWMA